jgi:hypothetical protein
MKLVVIDSIERLLTELNALPNHYIYRGHADANWRLASTLERVLGSSWSAESARKFEDYSLAVFESKFHLYDTENIQPNSTLAWLAIMQHYGVPTRLLDFTESPYVALYFALEGYTPHPQKNLAIFAVDYTAVMEKSIEYISQKDGAFKETRQTVHKKQDEVFENVVNRFAYDIAWITEPKQVNARLDRQAGSFLVSGNRSLRIEELLSSATYSAVDVRKYEICGELYGHVFALLRKMNITSKSLYGDLGGLARSIRMQMQLYAV